MGILFLYLLLILKVAIWVFDDFLPTYFTLYSGNEVSQSLLDTQVEVPSSTIASSTEIMPGIQDTSSVGALSDCRQQNLSNHNQNDDLNEVIITGNDKIAIKLAEVAVMGAGVDPLLSGEFVFIYFFLNFEMCDFLQCVIVDVFELFIEIAI